MGAEQSRKGSPPDVADFNRAPPSPVPAAPPPKLDTAPAAEERPEPASEKPRQEQPQKPHKKASRAPAHAPSPSLAERRAHAAAEHHRQRSELKVQKSERLKQQQQLKQQQREKERRTNQRRGSVSHREHRGQRREREHHQRGTSDMVVRDDDALRVPPRGRARHSSEPPAFRGSWAAEWRARQEESRWRRREEASAQDEERRARDASRSTARFDDDLDTSAAAATHEGEQQEQQQQQHHHRRDHSSDWGVSRLPPGADPSHPLPMSMAEPLAHAPRRRRPAAPPPRRTASVPAMFGGDAAMMAEPEFEDSPAARPAPSASMPGRMAAASSVSLASAWKRMDPQRQVYCIEDLLLSRPVGGRWVDKASVTQCERCASRFGVARRRHHCFHCGGVFCSACAGYLKRYHMVGFLKDKVRVCGACYHKSPHEQDKLPDHEAALENARVEAKELRLQLSAHRRAQERVKALQQARASLKQQLAAAAAAADQERRRADALAIQLEAATQQHREDQAAFEVEYDQLAEERDAALARPPPSSAELDLERARAERLERELRTLRASYEAELVRSSRLSGHERRNSELNAEMDSLRADLAALAAARAREGEHVEREKALVGELESAMADLERLGRERDESAAELQRERAQRLEMERELVGATDQLEQLVVSHAEGAAREARLREELKRMVDEREAAENGHRQRMSELASVLDAADVVHRPAAAGAAGNGVAPAAEAEAEKAAAAAAVASKKGKKKKKKAKK